VSQASKWPPSAMLPDIEVPGGTVSPDMATRMKFIKAGFHEGGAKKKTGREPDVFKRRNYVIETVRSQLGLSGKVGDVTH